MVRKFDFLNFLDARKVFLDCTLVDLMSSIYGKEEETVVAAEDMVAILAIGFWARRQYDTALGGKFKSYRARPSNG